MTTIYLVRHAEAEGNLYRRAQGHKNATITDGGYRQIAALSKRFADVPIDAVYSSDLCRTQTTAKAVTLSHRLELQTMPELREICVGVWEDQSWSEIAWHDRQGLIKFNTDTESWHVDGGEEITHVRDRMLRAIRTIIAAHPNGTVAAFSHGMAIRTLVGTLQGLTLGELNSTSHAENTAVTKLMCSGPDDIRVEYRDDASHLPESIRTLSRQTWMKCKDGIEDGIYFAPTETDGRFDVVRSGGIIGAVSVMKCENGIAEIGEYRLDRDEQQKGFGIRLIGQALCYARGHGCDILRVRVPKSNPVGLKCAVRYGFVSVLDTAECVIFEKYFGYSEEYQIRKLQEAIEKC